MLLGKLEAGEDHPFCFAHVVRQGQALIGRQYSAWRSLLNAGTHLSFGSDCPVEPLNPLYGIYAAVTRQRPDGTPPGGWYPEERLTVEEAVRDFTVGPAYTSGEEMLKGSIAPGKLADLVVLDRDIFSLPPAAILEAHVDYTILGGRIVFSKA